MPRCVAKLLLSPGDADLCRADVRGGKMPGAASLFTPIKRARTCAPDCAKRNRAGEDRARSLSLTTYAALPGAIRQAPFLYVGQQAVSARAASTFAPVC